MEHDKYNHLKPRRPHTSIDGFTRQRRSDYVHPRPSVPIKPPITQSTRSAFDINRLQTATSTPAAAQSMLNRSMPVNLQASDTRDKRHFKSKRSKKKLILRSGLIALALILCVGGWFGYKDLNAINKVFHGNVVTDAQALFSNVQLNGEAQGRVNILVLGDSADRVDAAANGGDLTDSMMVLSIDTKNNTAFMLSIPRDLMVDIPGHGVNKINATYEYTGFSGVEQLVQTDLGIPINYYALVNYQAFEDLVNAVGGITVDIQSPDPRGLYDPQPYPGAKAFYLANGEQTLNGATALNLARARGDAYGSYGFPQSDFNRTQHQRQMVVAIIQKAESLGVVTNPVKISQIFSALSSNVTTDLNLQDALALAKLGKSINLNSIQSESYSYGGTNALLTSYDTGGVSYITPAAGIGNYSQLQAFYQQLTSSNPVAREGATVTVLNGSDVVGLSHKEATVLQGEGFTVSSIADASQEYPTSMIVDMSSGNDPAALQALQKFMGGNTTTTTSTTTPIEATEAQGYTANFVVVLGKNWDTAQ